MSKEMVKRLAAMSAGEREALKRKVLALFRRAELNQVRELSKVNIVLGHKALSKHIKKMIHLMIQTSSIAMCNLLI